MPEGSSPTQPCPSCGIAVMIGYLKCPKCHAPMPGGSPRGRRESLAGGTTAERVDLEPIAGGRGAWVWLAALAVIGAGVAVWATQCRTSRRTGAPAAAVVDEGVPVSDTAPAEPPSQPAAPAPRAAGTPDPAVAADALEGELAAERLFATVEVTGELLDVRSAFCAEARLEEIVARHAAELRRGGVVRVRCRETYGAEVFERAL